MLAALVARVGLAVVDAEAFSDLSYLGLGDAGIGGANLYADIGAGPHGLLHWADEVCPAVGVDGMVAEMVGDEHLCEVSALSDATGYGKHDAVAERYDGGAHVVIGIVALRDGVGTFQK